MKNKTKTRMGYFFIILGILIIIGSLVGTWISEKSFSSSVEVKCYDYFGNEIIGQTCIDISSHSPVPYYYGGFGFFGVFVIVAGLFLQDSRSGEI